jgi:DNA-directed RNA polymerase specialized sigma24 family protein
MTVNLAFGGRARGAAHHHHRRPDPVRAAGAPATPEAAVDLEKAIATLPPGARRAHDVHGFKHEEIGGMLGVAVGTCGAAPPRAAAAAEALGR